MVATVAQGAAQRGMVEDSEVAVGEARCSQVRMALRLQLELAATFAVDAVAISTAAMASQDNVLVAAVARAELMVGVVKPERTEAAGAGDGMMVATAASVAVAVALVVAAAMAALAEAAVTPAAEIIMEQVVPLVVMAAIPAGVVELSVALF